MGTEAKILLFYFTRVSKGGKKKERKKETAASDSPENYCTSVTTI